MATGRLRRAALHSLLFWAPLCAAAFPLGRIGTADGGDAAREVRHSRTRLRKPRSRATSAAREFIIGLERPVEFQVFALTNPNRVFVELPEVMLQLPPHPGETAVGLVKSFRGGLSAPGKARVVIDVTGPVIVEKAAIEKRQERQGGATSCSRSCRPNRWWTPSSPTPGAP